MRVALLTGFNNLSHYRAIPKLRHFFLVLDFDETFNFSFSLKNSYLILWNNFSKLFLQVCRVNWKLLKHVKTCYNQHVYLDKVVAGWQVWETNRPATHKPSKRPTNQPTAMRDHRDHSSRFEQLTFSAHGLRRGSLCWFCGGVPHYCSSWTAPTPSVADLKGTIGYFSTFNYELLSKIEALNKILALPFDLNIYEIYECQNKYYFLAILD